MNHKNQQEIMPLADLLNIPHSIEDWNQFSFNNRNQITAIRQAIKAQKNINLTEYNIDPIDFNHFQDFLENNSQAHDDFNSVLGLQSSDIEELDPKDEKSLSSWIFTQYQELYSASAALKI